MDGECSSGSSSFTNEGAQARLALNAIVNSDTSRRYPIHECCTASCGDPLVLLQLLRTNTKYRPCLPQIEGRELSDSSDVDVNRLTRDAQQTTALHLACQLATSERDLTLVHLLLKAKADPNIKDAEGVNLVAIGDLTMLVIQRGHDIVPYLMEKILGSDPGIQWRA